MRLPVLSGITLALVLGMFMFGVVYVHTNDSINAMGAIVCAIGVVLCGFSAINPTRFVWILRFYSAFFAFSCVGAMCYDLFRDLSLLNVLLYIMPIELLILTVSFALKGPNADLPFARLFGFSD